MARDRFSVPSVVVMFVIGYSFPPETYAGQSPRSSGNEVRPRALGDKFDKIAAAYERTECIRG